MHDGTSEARIGPNPVILNLLFVGRTFRRRQLPWHIDISGQMPLISETAKWRCDQSRIVVCNRSLNTFCKGLLKLSFNNRP